MKKIKNYFNIITIISLFTILVSNVGAQQSTDSLNTDTIKAPKTDSLIVEIIKKGQGKAAKSGDFIHVYFKGMLNDSLKTVFNSVLAPQKALSFQLGAGNIIKGWNQGIAGMLEGEVRQLTVAPELAYGSRSVNNIPANSTLTFEIELVKIDAVAEFSETKDLKWQKLSHGIEFADAQVGQGVQVSSGSEVEIHSTGWLSGGSRFTASREKGTSLKFIVGAGQVLEGVEKGLKGMKNGGVRFLRLQPSVAYGAKSYARIPGGSVVIFKVELLDASAPSSDLAIDIFPEIDQIEWIKGDEGLEYAVIKAGDNSAVAAKMGNRVSVQYTGWLIDGKKFDSSRDRNQAFEFQLGAKQVIRGWEVGVAGMKPGEKRLLKIPPEIAYGSRGVSIIPPNATLIFAVELEEIK